MSFLGWILNKESGLSVRGKINKIIDGYQRRGVHMSAYGAAPDQGDLKIAAAAAAAAGVPLVIDVPVSVTYTNFSQIVELADDACLVFTPAGSIIMNTFGVPAFFHRTESGGKVHLVDPKFVFSGTITPTLPQISNDFYTETSGTFGYSNRDQLGMCFFRGTDLTIEGVFHCTPSDFSTVSKMVPRGLTIGCSADGAPAKLSADDFYFDGCLWGILAFGMDAFEIRDVYSARWSQLDYASTYTWEAPGHVIYLSSLHNVNSGADSRFSIGRVIDTGEEIGTPYIQATTSLKLSLNAARIDIGSVHSSRASGALDIDGQNVRIGGVFWDGSNSSQAKINPSKAMRLAEFETATGPSNVVIGPSYFRMPPDYATYINLTGKNITADLTIEIPGTATSTAQIFGDLNDSHIKLTLFMEQAQASTPKAVEITGGGSRNRFEIVTNSPEWETMRVIATDKSASQDNSAEIVHAQSGSKRHVSNFSEHVVARRAFNLSNVSGAAVTASGALKAGDLVMGVSSQVRTALGASNGTTGFSVGVSGDPDRFGVRVGTAVGGGTDNSTWTAPAISREAANADVIITASGGNFDGTGDFALLVHAERTIRNLDFT